MDFALFAPEMLIFTALFMLSAFFCWAFSRFGIPFFVAKPRDWTPERHHQTKQGIPTMGGLVLLGLWIVAILFFGSESFITCLPALWIMVSMGFLGAYDDWSKINRWGGISAGMKFIAQNIFALSAVGIWYWLSSGAGDLWIPLFDFHLPLGIFMLVWGALVIVSASNAINLTDGLDGLAAIVLTLCFGAIAYCAYGMGHEDVFFGSLFATAVMLGFLVFNCHPARLFMGDTGALAFGALLGFYAVQLNITLLLPLMAIVPVTETLSVMLQVAWFKRYQTRLFKMAPVHHHFELIGYSENQIVVGASIVTVLGCVVACAFLLLKN